MTLVSTNMAGYRPAATLDQGGQVSEDARWVSLRTVLDTGGPWILVEPCGAIRSAGVRLGHIADRIRNGSRTSSARESVRRYYERSSPRQRVTGRAGSRCTPP